MRIARLSTLFLSAWLLNLALIASSGIADDAPASSDEETAAPQAFIDASGPGWVAMGEDDFEMVNGNEDTWTWGDDGVLHCSGRPVGVCSSVKQYENFELSCEWMHLEHAGNSGIFVWTTEAALEDLRNNLDRRRKRLPGGIECQILDLGYEENHRRRNNGNDPNWFTSHGDIFACGDGTEMTPFPPLSANGSRSFPSEKRTLPFNNWNHYYIRCINGEVRLWVNGKEVSGGTDCSPCTGYICLESEGAPIDFKNIRIRELP